MKLNLVNKGGGGKVKRSIKHKTYYKFGKRNKKVNKTKIDLEQIKKKKNAIENHQLQKKRGRGEMKMTFVKILNEQ